VKISAPGEARPAQAIDAYYITDIQPGFVRKTAVLLKLRKHAQTRCGSKQLGECAFEAVDHERVDERNGRGCLFIGKTLMAQFSRNVTFAFVRTFEQELLKQTTSRVGLDVAERVCKRCPKDSQGIRTVVKEGPTRQRGPQSGLYVSSQLLSKVVEAHSTGQGISTSYYT